MGKAWIDGASAPFPDAVAAAARHLSRSRQPLVTGLQTDVAGIRAALALARASGGVLDHSGSAALYRMLDVVRGSGLFRGVPAELRRRCDRLLVVGPDAAEIAPGLLAWLLSGPVDLGRGAGRRRAVVWLGAPAGGTLAADAVETVPCELGDIAGLVGVMRARLGGRRFDRAAPGAERAAGLADWLAGAAFAGIVWSPAAIDGLAVEMLAGLVSDLNGPTRASSVVLGPADGAAGAAEVATWTTGYPLRVGFSGRIGFSGGEAEHDPYRFDGARLVASGECDLVVRVSALDGAGSEAPGIAVLRPAEGGDRPVVAFETAMAGRDHPGALWDERLASFVPFEPARESLGASGNPSAAEVLGAIAGALGGGTDAGVAASDEGRAA